ncbi:DNA polymerase III, subunit gamma and tau [Pseudoalteromonas luteoviolacea]|uniref:DNA-directed DNA polymerase n=1 Tax=Pseudoalteromonas luteoviolacea TaxID=43657 RepID=A0A1C0TSY1_9GAMM|nr:DNA polymerase III subunit gamma/tau [Pseudoalteromonas luteoviolacea]OCQ22420.1 DNA polymerase III, subunit gamma and tau [Pseudoalteromonas luteoviolacea]
MSYQVLARKWRPQSFHEMMGQEHVKQALINALNEQRLHHAYLFTGTRGVGKTTIARIFAKSLNCEQGISSTPCGQCGTCEEIESGKFIDLIEIDAASRTKVEDTREILDNVQYAPTRGRYKVYLIDEVHMLSKHSFNALLKTLEEPPEHVKFLLATTDPQKLPITILSRCLQFNLNAMAKGQIVEQLAKILPSENFQFEQEALEIIAKAADGSMRDALSLTDQAIAQTNGQLNVTAVQQMLGLMDSAHAMLLMSAILCQDGSALMSEIDNIALKNGNFTSVIDDLISLMHIIQLTQLVPQAAHMGQFDKQQIKMLAEQVSPQTAQFYYQLLLTGKKDLSWAPDARLGFEMVMLRLLAFEGTDLVQLATTAVSSKSAQNANQSRAGALRDILNSNQNKAQVQTHSSQQQTPSTTPIEQQTSSEQPQLRTAQHHQLPNSGDVLSDRPSIAPHSEPPQVTQPQPQSQPNLPPPTSVIDSQDQFPPMEQQFNDVMAQATAQGFDEQNQYLQNDTAPVNQDMATEQPVQQPSNTKRDAQTLYSQKQGEAQSAIAKILQNRQISGAGKLLGGNETPKKPEQGSVIQPASKVAQSNALPTSSSASQPVGSFTETSSKQVNDLGSNTNSDLESRQPIHRPKPKKPEISERFKKDESKLAPELIEQLTPQQSQSDEDEHKIEIPIPENFVSPISDIKFAHQKDDWAKLIEAMELSGRVRQFALHAMYQKQASTCILSTELSQQHLDSPMLREKLQESFSKVLNEPIELQLEFIEQVNSTPFLIQQDIDQQRYLEAVDAVNADPVIQTMVAEFDATVNEKSVKAL